MRWYDCLRWVLCLVCLLPGSAYAGGAIKTNILGLPLHWEGTITFNPDKGTLKNGVYTHAQSVQIIQDAFNAWTDALGTSAEISIAEGVSLPEDGDDVTEDNYQELIGGGTDACYDNDPGTECLSPVVFDEDGEILDSLFGQCSKFSILGFAGYDDIDDGSGDPTQLIVRRGQALFSGACLPDALGNTEVKPGCGTCKRALTDQEIRTIITHEMGHLLGMDHSQVNPDSFALCGGVDGCPSNVAQDIPTMFPILVNQAQMLDLHRDDIAYIQRLYGNTSNDCTISGRVLASNGSTEVRGVEVVARNLAPGMENSDAISFISGAEAPRVNSFGKGQGNCREHCGDFTINGLQRGESYQLCVQPILAQFTGGSSIEPVDPPFQGVTTQCFQDSVVFCGCAGGACENFTGKDIVTNINAASVADQEEPSQIQEDAGIDDASGGCSLAKPRTGIWKHFQKNLRDR